MNDRICIMYEGRPAEALAAAIREHGEQNSFLLVPNHMTWLVPKSKGSKNASDKIRTGSLAGGSQRPKTQDHGG
ncbi:hypothetical protein DESC_500147 [Desulfosarcina cetonica]|nr:hypothetical protein DESC_500147 [Desulfosarcina cetonica]